MARKRMISPEIWESQNFSLLSDLGKLVFISLFSHADDEGRGRADTGYIKSMTFPYDDNRRVADVKNALSEIARRMSVQFYSVDGSDYYFMTSWERWQKIDRPTKSKLPPPPCVGVRGPIRSNEKFDESSTNTRRVLDEGSTPNRIERNRIESNIPPGACAYEGSELNERLNRFCEKWNIAKDTCHPYLDDIDFDLLDKAYAESKTLLQDTEKAPYAHTLSWIVKNYRSIIANKYKDRPPSKKSGKSAHEKGTDILKTLFNESLGEEDDGT